MEKENIYVVKVPATEENLPDEKLLEYLIQKNMLTPAYKDKVIREQNRLRHLGYDCQIGVVLYHSGIISKEILMQAYQDLCKDVAIVNAMMKIEDMQLPRIRIIKPPEKQPKTKTANIPKAKAIKAPKAKAIKAPKAKATNSSKKPSTKIQPEYEPETDHQEEYVDVCEEENNTMSTIQDSSMEDATKLQEILEILQRLDAKVLSTAQATPVAQEQVIPSPIVSADEGNERTNALQGMKLLSSDKALELLQKGQKLTGYHIPELQLGGREWEGSLSITECAIDNLDASNAKFGDNVDFEGCTFLSKPIFKGATFTKDTKFSKANFLDGADFAKTEFLGETRFHTSQFQRYVTFNRSKFAKKVIFSYSQFARGVKFNEVEFLATASFNNMRCGHRFGMNDCVFHDETSFSNAEFSEIADFEKSIFGEVAKFLGTFFAKYASFKYVDFQSDFLMSGACIEGDLLFNHSKFAGLIDLQAISAEHNVNFKEVKLGEHALFQVRDAYFGRLFLTIPQLEGHLQSQQKNDFKVAREEFGLLKNNFREINEYACEDWAYLWEKRMARKNAPGIKAFLEWLVLDIPCGYGTKTLNIFPTLFVLFLSFSVLFLGFGTEFNPNIEPIIPGVITADTPHTTVGILDAIQISFCTLTNLNIGDWTPRRGSWINYLMMFESFLGFLLMNVVIVVTFSRKVSR